jgi:hypothetical protein
LIYVIKMCSRKTYKIHCSVVKCDGMKNSHLDCNDILNEGFLAELAAYGRPFNLRDVRLILGSYGVNEDPYQSVAKTVSTGIRNSQISPLSTLRYLEACRAVEFMVPENRGSLMTTILKEKAADLCGSKSIVTMLTSSQQRRLGFTISADNYIPRALVLIPQENGLGEDSLGYEYANDILKRGWVCGPFMVTVANVYENLARCSTESAIEFLTEMFLDRLRCNRILETALRYDQ